MTQRSTPSEPNLVFWKVQAVGWSAYAFALMMPWIGEYLVSIMLPNKVVVAGTGLLVSSGLRELYRWTVRAGAGADLRLLAVLAVIASAFGGLVWDRAVASLVGASAALDLRQFGVLDGGMPRLGGALYHALVLFAWTTVYLAVHGWKSRSEAVATTT